MVPSHNDRPETETGEKGENKNPNRKLKKPSLDGDNNEEINVDTEEKQNGNGDTEAKGDADRDANTDGDSDGKASTASDDFKHKDAAIAKENNAQKGNCGKRKAEGEKGEGEKVLAPDEWDKTQVTPRVKQLKTDLGEKQQASPVPDDPTTHKSKGLNSENTQGNEAKAKNDPGLTNREALLNQIEEYICEAIDGNDNVQRKVLDALLNAINVQVQSEPLSVRNFILEKQIVLPNTISFPPSQVVDLVIEHDPDFPLSKVLTNMFGEKRLKHSKAEEKETAFFKQNFAAPHMTRLLTEIGQELVQSSYCNIAHTKNPPKKGPKKLETYKQVANQLKPVSEKLRKKTEENTITCQACNFKTESRLVMISHRSALHYDGTKYQCSFCGETDTNEDHMMKHYLKNHEVVATKPDPLPKHPCYICDKDFPYKSQRDQHMRAVCERDFANVRFVMAPKNKEDVLAINTWLWQKPPVRQQNKREQQEMQRLQQQSFAQLFAIKRQQQKKQETMQQQLLQAQKPLLGQPSAQSNIRSSDSGQSFKAAMQRHLAQVPQQQSQQTRNSSSILGDATALQWLFQRNLVQKLTATPFAKLSQPSQISSAMRSSVPASLGNATLNRNPVTNKVSSTSQYACEICDQNVQGHDVYLTHLQVFHKQMKGKTVKDMQQGAQLACHRCKEKFWTHEGLERHLVMSYGLVTSDLLRKAESREDGGRCKHCSKQYIFNMLQHLVAEHQVNLYSAKIKYSCHVCSFACASYQQLESHLSTVHPKSGRVEKNGRAQTKFPPSNGAIADEEIEIITLD